MPAATTGSKDLDALVARFKRGYSVEKQSSGHFRVRDPQGNYVEHNDKVITLTGTAHGGRAVNNMEAALKGAGVLRTNGGSKRTDKTHWSEAERKARMETLRIRAANRQEVADALYERMTAVLKAAGVDKLRGVQADLSIIGTMVAREKGDRETTPDLFVASISRVLHDRGWVAPKYQEVWNEVAARLETTDDPTAAWFALVRKARGIPEEIIEVKRPVEGEWPFDVELLPVESFLVDSTYQRPPDWSFVRKNAQRFDPSLVGTVDVSERRRGAVYAVLDGRHRLEICKMVGKTTIWASVYRGLDIPSEARFFLHKNKDKKAMHPFYTFRARLAADDLAARDIDKLVRQYGYKLTFQSANDMKPEQISAIASLDETYNRHYQSEDDTALAPTLAVMKEATFGMRQGNNALLIRALGIVFSEKAEKIDESMVIRALKKTTPELLTNRAREAARYANSNTAWAMAREIISDYDRLAARGEKLGRL
jgi:uncharacterized protein DUF6551